MCSMFDIQHDLVYIEFIYERWELHSMISIYMGIKMIKGDGVLTEVPFTLWKIKNWANNCVLKTFIH